MAKVIWCGNKDWNELENNEQPWDKEIAGKHIPEDAVLLDRPKDFVKAATKYMIVPFAVSFFVVFLKRQISDVFGFDFRFMPVSFLLAFVLSLPVHEFLHAICYPKGEKVYIGVCLKQLRAFVATSAAITRRRFIVMSLAPLASGILAMAVFLLCPPEIDWLMTLCVAPMFMVPASLAPDYMDILLVLKQVPKDAMIQATEDGLVWYKKS